MYGYIYKTTNLVNGNFYIGKHKASTFDESYFGSGLLITKAIAKYGVDCFKCEIMPSINNVPTICNSLKELNASERYYISLFKDEHCYNIANGGDGGDIVSTLSDEDYAVFIKKVAKNSTGKKNGFYGKHHSEETKKKISKANKGRKLIFTIEHRRRLSEANRHRVHKKLSLESRKKLSASLKGKNTWSKGRKLTPEHRKHISDAAKGAKNSRARSVRCIETGVIYDYIDKACEETGATNIGACCRSKLKTSGGYHWEYVNNNKKKIV